MMIFIVFSSLYSIDKGYYIYKFGIDSNDSISLYNSKFIDEFNIGPKNYNYNVRHILNELNKLNKDKAKLALKSREIVI